MAEIGEPIRRHTVVPLTEPVIAPEPQTSPPSRGPQEPSLPGTNPSPQKSPTPEYEPAN